MPTFSLFPKQSPNYPDLRSPRSSMASSQHSPSNSFSSMTESMYSSASTACSSIDSPPYPAPLRIGKRQQVSFSGVPQKQIRHKCLEDKPLPLALSPSLENLSKHSSFQARRPAPRPPVESWIDWSDDSDDDMDVKPAMSRPARFSSMRHPPAPSSYPSLGSIEEEIMTMLQATEEEEKRGSIHKIQERHRMSKSFGDIVGKLRRSLTLSDSHDWRRGKRTSYFDCMI
jgi:hypothetical protein